MMTILTQDETKHSKWCCAFGQVGSCARAHKEVLKACWVCDACPLKGLKCEGREEVSKKDHEKDKMSEEEEEQFAANMRAPCEKPPQHGFMWIHKEGKWKQLACN